MNINNLDKRLIAGLNKDNIKELTDVQKECFEPIMQMKNVVASSRTGTGKTLAYLLPIISKAIQMNSKSERDISLNSHQDVVKNNTLYSVILAPTKELCIQICSEINKISNNSGIPVTAAALFGGVNRQRQLLTLKSKPNIVVGTYDRIYELIKDKKISVHNVKTLVIDEADRILTKDNMSEIISFRKCFMRDIQVILVSASIKESTLKVAESISGDFVKILTNDKIQIPTNISHYYFVVDKRDKIEMTRKVISALNDKHCIVFSGSKYDTEEITQKLIYHHYDAECLNAACDKNLRRQITDRFKTGKTHYLICSDLVSRGLDFRNVNLVVNIGLPDKPVDYLHRCGRCGRDGSQAICVSIITESEIDRIKKIQKTYNINMLQKKLYQGKIVRK